MISVVLNNPFCNGLAGSDCIDGSVPKLWHSCYIIANAYMCVQVNVSVNDII